MQLQRERVELCPRRQRVAMAGLASRLDSASRAVFAAQVGASSTATDIEALLEEVPAREGDVPLVLSTNNGSAYVAVSAMVVRWCVTSDPQYARSAQPDEHRASRLGQAVGEAHG